MDSWSCAVGCDDGVQSYSTARVSRVERWKSSLIRCRNVWDGGGCSAVQVPRLLAKAAAAIDGGDDDDEDG